MHAVLASALLVQARICILRASTVARGPPQREDNQIIMTHVTTIATVVACIFINNTVISSAIITLIMSPLQSSIPS